MSDSPHIEISGEDKSKKEAKFQSADIGRWASQQENPFAAQNRKALAKRQKNDEKRKKTAPYIIIGASVLAVVTGVVGLVLLINGLRGSLPSDITLGSEGATEIQDQAQAVYDRYLGSDGEMTEEQAEEAIKAATDFFNNKNNLTNDETTKAELGLVEMTFYSHNSQWQMILNMADRVDVDKLSEIGKSQYYGLLMNAAYNVGDNELGQQYFDKLESVSTSTDDYTEEV